MHARQISEPAQAMHAQFLLSLCNFCGHCDCWSYHVTTFHGLPRKMALMLKFFYIFLLFGILESLCPSVVLSVCPIVSAECLLNCSTIFLPNLVRWCTIMRQCVLWKDWFTIFNVKVTARAYIIKIWLFLLHLLNCWSICNQTWFDGTES